MTTTIKTDQWTPLLKIAQLRVDECTRRIAELLIRRDESDQKLRMLVGYRTTYQDQHASAQRKGIPADELRNYQSFVATLEHATEEQSSRLAAIEQLVGESKSEAAVLQRKIHSYRVLRDRQEASARKTDLRRQQSLQDEMASRMRRATG